MCKKEYNKKDNKVKNHCHITRKYRGSTHKECYLNLSVTKKISVVFHNLQIYDSHFMFQELQI